MTERRISKESVEKAIKDPDDVSNTKYGRKVASKLIRSKLLRIVYEEENDSYTIMTASYTQAERY